MGLQHNPSNQSKSRDLGWVRWGRHPVSSPVGEEGSMESGAVGNHLTTSREVILSVKLPSRKKHKSGGTVNCWNKLSLKLA